MSGHRDLSGLDEKYAGLFTTYLGELERTFPQFEVIVTYVRRTKEEQLALVGQGPNTSRTRYSNHLLGRAIDVAFLRRSTRAIDWEPETYENVYTRLPPQDFGLISGGELWKGWDYGHLQLRYSRACYPYLIGSKEDVWLTDETS